MPEHSSACATENKKRGVFVRRRHKVKSLHERNTKRFHCVPPRTFHVFNFIVAYLSLLHFAAWIVGRPHSGCRGHKGDNGSPLGLRWWKRHTAAGVLPRLQHWFYTVVLFHTGWINGKETKGQVPPFFYPFLRTFGGSLKVQNSVRESDLWHHLFWFCISLSKMMSGLWQRSVECVTPRVEWCQNWPGKMINLMFLYFSGYQVRSSCYLFIFFAEPILAIAAKLKVLSLSRWISISVSDELTLL